MSTSRRARSTRKVTGFVPLARIFFLALVLCGFAFAAVCTEDAVYLAAPNSPQARAKVTGRVLDYNGRDLLLDTGGNQKRYPAEQVVGVDSEWTPTQLAADELFARREYAEALVKYEEAVRSEPRRWVQRKLVAQYDLVPAQPGTVPSR